MKIFTVIMQRDGDPEAHQYLIGAYSCLAKAIIQGLENERYRAQKYEPCVQETELDGNDRCLKISRSTVISYAKLKYPEKFNDRDELIDE